MAKTKSNADEAQKAEAEKVIKEQSENVGSFGGIGVDTKVKSAIPFLPPILQANGTYEFPIGYLTRVSYERILNKNKDYNDVLIFEMTDKNKERTHKEQLFFPSDPSKQDKKGKTALEVFNTKVGHIYNEFATITETIGGKATTKEEYMQALADAFNNNGKNADGESMPVFFHKPFWIKLVFNDAGFLQTPYAPNFIEKFAVNKTCTLTVFSGDKIIAPKRDKKKADILEGISGGTGSDEFPEWPTED